MPLNRSVSSLKAYETYIPSSSSLLEEVFGLTTVIVIGAFVGLGLFFHTIKALPEPIEKKIEEIKTRFVIEEREKPKPKPVEKKKPEPEKPEEKPIDLTEKPELAQKLDDIPKEPPPVEAPVAPRRVYGLRRVYSVGIGAGGSMADAVIGKLGNTTNTDVDTVTATKQDLKGTLAPITAITTPPSPINASSIKPEYTREMLEAKVEGAIRAELLIDVDGKVKDVRILNDLGFGTKESAEKAFRQWLFEPAKKGDTPVAVWIAFSIRFMIIS
jgi:protein TonB